MKFEILQSAVLIDIGTEMMRLNIYLGHHRQQKLHKLDQIMQKQFFGSGTPSSPNFAETIAAAWFVARRKIRPNGKKEGPIRNAMRLE